MNDLFIKKFNDEEIITFRKWLRREVLPELRAKGTYSINKESYKDNLKDENENLSLYIQDKLNKERNLSLLLEVLNLIDRITSKENEDKLRYLNDILNG
ncbi:MAG: hypothetical protein E7F17_12720 [Clostridium perfringens]|uniref:hypothetical protein n=1 Tax=Clostridium perfringens TaxID=1502 RepID=UPI001AD7F7F0|nr:hypothetical protein [Clostridium perfringens]EJT6144549.1 hypothetical protein [Clostridium perfringens]MDM0903969.1 hypothetical protein [Clostridium perfringens]MDO5353676.1 hypothetical protein [Clostridium perfringens]MDU1686221.1 hypothetical protein [Clostridium perfringens]MDU1811575.1 hypothetical protein [Clostridium perfringens]